MKYSDWKSFEKHLQSASPDHLSSVYLVLGKEEFFRLVAYESLIGLLTAKKQSIIRYEAQQIDDKQLDNELNGWDLFSSARLIIITNCDKLSKTTSEILQNYIPKASKDLAILLMASSVNANTNFYKKTEKFGVVFSPDNIKPKDVESYCVEWLIKNAAKHRKTMLPAAASLLVRHIGLDYIGLVNELEKLTLFVGDRNDIQDKDVIALVQAIPQATAWQASDAIFQGNAAEALRLCHLLLQSGTALIALIRQLRRTFQTGYEICTLLTSGATHHDIGQHFPQLKGFILDKNIQSARQYGPDKFRAGIVALDTSEFAAKDSGGDDELIMEKMIVKLVIGISTPINNYGH